MKLMPQIKDCLTESFCVTERDKRSNKGKVGGLLETCTAQTICFEYG